MTSSNGGSRARRSADCRGERAGKTTFARWLVPALHSAAQFLNADEIQRLDERFAHPVAAGREMLQRLAMAEAESASFVLETPLSSAMDARRIAAWRGAGCVVALHFIELPSEQHAVDRVAAPVRAGGHDIPDADIRRRFHRGLALFETVDKHLVDRWHHRSSNEAGVSLVGYQRNSIDC
jgi:predicted ABC-type ATPase